MTDESEVVRQALRRSEHWLLELMLDRLLQDKPDRWEPTKYDGPCDQIRGEAWREGWWDAVDRVVSIVDEIRAPDGG